jgi:hypothetical protein
MENWLYTVWFKDNRLEPNEEDYEWCACIVIEANSPEEAVAWGNTLSTMYISSHSSNEFLTSNAIRFDKEGYKHTEDLPFIRYGQVASDEEIGW